MGMSSDYIKAIEYKSTFVRIGSGIFGKRVLGRFLFYHFLFINFSKIKKSFFLRATCSQTVGL